MSEKQKEITLAFKNLPTSDIKSILNYKANLDDIELIKNSDEETKLHITEILDIVSEIYDTEKYKDIIYRYSSNLFYNTSTPELLIKKFKQGYCEIPQEIIEINTNENWDWEPSKEFSNQICISIINVLETLYLEYMKNKQIEYETNLKKQFEAEQKEQIVHEQLSLELINYIYAYERETNKEINIPDLTSNNQISKNKPCANLYKSYKKNCDALETKHNIAQCIHSRFEYISKCANNTIDYSHAKFLIKLFKMYFRQL